MARYVDFHTQLASIMEVLANAAVAEICQLVDDEFANLRLEISRSQRENLALKSRLRLVEVRSDHQFGEDVPVTKRGVQSATLERTQLPSGTEQPLEPEVVPVKKECLEEELTSCSVLEEAHKAAPNATGIRPPCSSVTAEGDRPQSVEAEVPRVSASGHFENKDFARPEAAQQVEKDQYSGPADHRTIPSSGEGRARETTDLTRGEDRQIADVFDSPSAECRSRKVLDVEMLESELTNAGVKGMCAAAADWSGKGASAAAVKLEAEASWAEAFSTQSASVVRNESDTAELDASSLDSSSFDDLFSSPEVASCLTAPHRPSTDIVAIMEEPSSSFPFLSSFGSSSLSDSLAATSFSRTSSDSRSRSFPSRTERSFSCQQCTCLFSTSRDLLVHQRSHAGEKVYHCPLCKKPFVHLHQLKTHQRVHTGEKPFSCTQCGRRFSQSSHIKRHMSVHTGEKRYSCSLCGKRFSQACSLKVHQAVHTGERPYSCTKCGKSFSVLGNLVRHQSVHVSK